MNFASSRGSGKRKPDCDTDKFKKPRAKDSTWKPYGNCENKTDAQNKKFGGQQLTKM